MQVGSQKSDLRCKYTIVKGRNWLSSAQKLVGSYEGRGSTSSFKTHFAMRPTVWNPFSATPAAN